MLWRVIGTEKYFVGGVHALPRGDHSLPERYLAAVAASELGVFECDFSIEDQSFDFLPPGTTLSKLLPHDLMRDVTYMWHKHFEIAEKVNRIKAWKVANVLIGHIVGNDFGPDIGVDQQLIAKFPKERRRFLETRKEALVDFFDKTPLAEQIVQLAKTVRDPDAVVTRVGRMVAAFKASDLAELEKILIEASAEMPVTIELLVRGRNELWLPRIVSILSEPQSVVFVLGILHFAGAHSLQKLLAKQWVQLELIGPPAG